MVYTCWFSLVYVADVGLLVWLGRLVVGCGCCCGLAILLWVCCCLLVITSCYVVIMCCGIRFGLVVCLLWVG